MSLIRGRAPAGAAGGREPIDLPIPKTPLDPSMPALPFVAVGALVAASAVALVIMAAVAPQVWAVDAERNLRAGAAIAAGRFGDDRGYLYSPLAALLTVPATWLPAGVAIGAWFVIRLGLLVEGVRRASAGLGHRWIDRAVVVVAVVAFVPSLHDLLLGNVSILLAGAVAVVVWRRDGFAAGIPLGLILATAPKPQLIPFLVWLLLWRRHALAGAAVTAGLATAAALALVGPDPYLAWIDILRRPDYLTSVMAGNLSLAGLYPSLALPLSVAAIAATAVALTRGPLAGLVACLCLGLLVAPYTMAYGVLALLPVVPAVAVHRPRAVLALALTGSIGVIVALPVWLAGVMATALSLPKTSRPDEEPV